MIRENISYQNYTEVMLRPRQYLLAQKTLGPCRGPVDDVATLDLPIITGLVQLSIQEDEMIIAEHERQLQLAIDIYAHHAPLVMTPLAWYLMISGVDPSLLFTKEAQAILPPSLASMRSAGVNTRTHDVLLGQQVQNITLQPEVKASQAALTEYGGGLKRFLTFPIKSKSMVTQPIIDRQHRHENHAGLLNCVLMRPDFALEPDLINQSFFVPIPHQEARNTDKIVDRVGGYSYQNSRSPGERPLPNNAPNFYLPSRRPVSVKEVQFTIRQES